MSHPIGIDLGTTNSVVAYVEGARAETIPNSEGQPTTPSVVLLREEDLVVGELAKRQLVTLPQNTVRSVKRLMGQRFSEVKDRLADYFFKIVEGPNDQALIQLGELVVTPEEVSAAILTKMRMTAEEYLGEDIDQAVITVPAHFNDSQRTATKKAAELAGLEVLRIINEPTAAALAYGIDKQRNEIVAVFDFGGGTFDISLLQLSKGIFEVLSTNGDTQLGGDNLDRVLTQWIIERIREETLCDPELDIQALQRIREAAEKVKCELSSLNSTAISLPFIVADDRGPQHFNREIKREEFLAMGKPVFDRLLPPCRQAMYDAGIEPDAISRVLLVGGSTRIPEVRRIVQELFQKPASHEINPDEAVALGAAIQSGIISGSLQEVLLLDVVPLSLGIELAGGLFKPLIARNSSIPTTAKRKFTTVVDNQSSVVVHVLQGERKMAKENRTLARFRLTGIAPAPQEVPEIEVRFHIDANGILQVDAQDMTSGTADSVVIESYSSMVPTQDEVERAVHDAREHAAEDESFAAHARQLERVQQLQYQMNRFLELVDGITEQDVRSVKEGMIRLDLAARAQEWIEIDTVGLQFKMIKGRYGSEDTHGGLVTRPLPLPTQAPPSGTASTGLAEAASGEDQEGEEEGAVAGEYAAQGDEVDESPEPGFVDLNAKLKPRSHSSPNPLSGEPIHAFEEEKPLPKARPREAAPPPSGSKTRKSGARPAPASVGEDPPTSPEASQAPPPAVEAAQAPPPPAVEASAGEKAVQEPAGAAPGAAEPGSESAAPQPKKFTPPSWLLPSPGKPPKK